MNRPNRDARRPPEFSLPSLCQRLGVEEPERFRSFGFSGVTCRGSETRPGDLFVVMDEYLRYNIWENGEQHLTEALDRGAVAVIAEKELPGVPVPVLKVADARLALADAARLVTGEPDQAIDLIGVTGTNGKTTTTVLTAHLLQVSRGSAASMGTLGVFLNGKKFEEGEYTTDLIHITCQRLARLREKGVRAAAMEVSSHALALDRVARLQFRVAVLTNLTRDHLDFHGDMERYQAAKQRLFAELGPGATAVLNVDDPRCEAFALVCKDRRVVRYSASGKTADLRAKQITCSPAGTSFVLEARNERYEVKSPLIGRFQVANILAALGVVYALEFPLGPAVTAIANFQPVPGRMQTVPLPNGATGVVDFAHNPDGLANLVENCRSLTSGKIHLVFGCGGDRDRGKRPMMGAAAAAGADVCWITSDNPRTEDPDRIIADILEGMPRDPAPKIEPDREKAIRSAYAATTQGDLLVVAGKGHEPYQLVGDKKIPFSDQAILTSLSVQ